MQHKFTPGPWSSGYLPWRDGDGYSYGGECTVSIPEGPTIILGRDEKWNARLIAASPDLVAALKMALPCIPIDANEQCMTARKEAAAALVRAGVL